MIRYQKYNIFWRNNRYLLGSIFLRDDRRYRISVTWRPLQIKKFWYSTLALWNIWLGRIKSFNLVAAPKALLANLYGFFCFCCCCYFFSFFLFFFYINIYKKTKTIIKYLKSKQKSKVRNIKQKLNFTQHSPQSNTLVVECCT